VDGEDQERGARVEGDAESAAGLAAAAVADGVLREFGYDEFRGVGLRAVSQVAVHEPARLADLGLGAGEVAAPPVDLFGAVQRWGHRRFPCVHAGQRTAIRFQY